MIQSLSTEYPVNMLCETLGVSRGATWPRSERCPGPRHQGNQKLVGQIRQAHEASRGTYGSPRVHWELNAQGIRCEPASIPWTP